ncbi:MAG TPA: hypothetical protein VN734_13290 [Acidobacteriaceae bacterium]|nr:hypothetical protein [Acidobacteriaceae bacterium]
MSLNQAINLGVINRLAASVTVSSNLLLTVTPPFLTKQGIRLAPDGDATKFIEVMTGVVPSPEPYIMMTARIGVVKTMPLAAAYQTQFLTNTLLGNVTIRPDVSRGSGGLQPFVLNNAALMSMPDMDFSGENAEFVVSIRGSWYINSALWTGLANLAIPT